MQGYSHVKKTELLQQTVAGDTKKASIGFGCYRIAQKEPMHREALIYAIENGIHLIDTSGNYSDGESEEVIGEVLVELFAKEYSLRREHIYLISKYGYINGQNLARYEAGLKFPDTVEYNPQLMHCIHPEFMKDQLTRSLQRLKTSYLDCYLLHNPEYYILKNISKFQSADKRADDAAVHAEMLRRISLAFEYLEQEVVHTGRVKSYGISSNSFSLKEEDPHFLPYSSLLSLAEAAAVKISGEGSHHHFTTVQFPANLVEKEALSHAVQWASRNHLNVLINRPLNAFLDKGSWRLADYPDKSDELLAVSHELKEECMELKFHKVLEALKESEQCVMGEFAMSFFEWENYLEGYLYPTIRKTVMEDRLDSSQRALDKLQAWIDLLCSVANHKSGVHTRDFLTRKLHYSIPERTPLQEFALKFLLQTPGVSYVLVGQRRIEYVDNILHVLKDIKNS
ncbi:hypothetical protein IE077_001409 [Cardiosporidium cionae]|uniref:NADP-dependent oxidoreductase domain-containing protein n=1 Tax=Cardiosporidium cionae TaxID=476202 RepID=A0ABQ7J5D4_9APIC|nr:hypothetical protein IE077_001409 [Cardiosporidium cionae]|eukprot:KAF8819214.1 hypothetical protein IE077_001409 [Cardiosporidium cionae]